MGVGKALGAATPKKVTSTLATHPWSRNPRKEGHIALAGVTPRRPRAMGMSSDTAPQKHEMPLFGGFGNDFGQKR